MRAIFEAFYAKRRVYQALIIRFVVGRYGRSNIGFMWTIVEPMMLCLGVMAIWKLTKGDASHGVSMVAFAFTGYMPLTLWRHQTGSMVNILKALKFLTIFKNLTLFDALISRLLLEFISVSAAAAAVFAMLYAVGLLEEPHDLGMMLQGWFMMGALGMGAGILIAALSEMSDVIEKVNQPFQYFLLPFAGCFYMIDWLPDSAKEYAQYIPLTIGYELIRGGYFGPAVRIYANPFYAFSVALIFAGLGCLFFEQVKNRVEA